MCLPDYKFLPHNYVIDHESVTILSLVTAVHIFITNCEKEGSNSKL